MAGFDGASGRPPRLESSCEVGRPTEPQALEGGCREARLLPLVANEDHVTIQVVAEAWIAVSRRRVEAPLEYVAGKEVRAWNDAVDLALTLGANVNQHRARYDGVACLLRIESSQSLARRVEQLMDRRP